MDGLEASIKIESNQIISHNFEEKNQYQINGKIYFNNHEYFIRYKEPDLGNTWTIIKWNNLNVNKVSILRQGEIRTEQKIYKANYRSPSGDIQLATFTKELSIRLLNKWEGNIFLAYELTSQGEYIGEYRIKINFKGIKDG